MGDHGDGLRAVPFAFVGVADECAPGWPAGSRIVTAGWLGGMGLPDNGGPNYNLTNPADAPNKDDAHTGLLMSKNGRSEICSSSGAEIKGVRGMLLTATSELGYDNRNGGHCGGGAPRFNVVVKNPTTMPPNQQTFHFVGACNNGTPGLALQDPAEWTQWRFATATTGSFPPIPPGSIVVSITLMYDEGTDTPSLVSEDAGGVGLAVVDNIYIDGQVIRSGSGIATGPAPRDDDCDKDGIKNDVDTDDDNDGLVDAIDTDDDNDGVDDVLQAKLVLPLIPR